MRPEVVQTDEPECAFYTPEQLLAVEQGPIPHHVAFIPDGNRRWAKKRGVSVAQGHREGADRLIDIVKAAKALGIKTVTFYSFSTENWTRSQLEIQAIFWLLESYLIEQCPTMVNSGIRYNTIGDLSRFPASVRQTIQQTKNNTAHCNAVEMIMALNYGGRDELKRAFASIVETRAWEKEAITESLISRYLDTAGRPDPDLLIRTSGESRLSNFLLWQTSYSEIYMTDVLWPDFTPTQLLKAVLDFQKRDRRLGGA